MAYSFISKTLTWHVSIRGYKKAEYLVYRRQTQMENLDNFRILRYLVI